MAPNNILLIVADDLGRQLGCYGDRLGATPHLDQLAAEGVVFSHAFACTASCSASRSTLYTGLSPHENGTYGLHNGRNHFMTFDHVETAPALLNNHGYLTGIIGKVHVGPDLVYPWQHREESATRDVAYISDRCGNFLNRAVSEDNPFFLTVAFIDPHRDLTRAGFGNDDTFDPRVTRKKFLGSEVPIPVFMNDTPWSRQELASYYQSIHRMDQGVGMILEGLRQRGLYDNTLIIFVSDNGPPFINSKTTLYDAGINLPLIVRRPGSTTGPTVNPNLVSFLDVLPTILDWAGHPAAAHRGSQGPRLGQSILPILAATAEVPGWQRVYGSHTFHEITNYWPTRFVRSRRYKYHRNLAWRLDFPLAADIYGSLSWEDVRNAEARTVGGRRLCDYFFRPPEELYDLERDPQELENLANSPDYALVLADLRGRLEAWQRRSADPWLYRDGVSLLFVKHHVAAGLSIPDRVDFDPATPGIHERDKVTVKDVRFGADVDWLR